MKQKACYKCVEAAGKTQLTNAQKYRAVLSNWPWTEGFFKMDSAQSVRINITPLDHYSAITFLEALHPEGEANACMVYSTIQPYCYAQGKVVSQA